MHTIPLTRTIAPIRTRSHPRSLARLDEFEGVDALMSSAGIFAHVDEFREWMRRAEQRLLPSSTPNVVTTELRCARSSHEQTATYSSAMFVAFVQMS